MRMLRLTHRQVGRPAMQSRLCRSRREDREAFLRMALLRKARQAIRQLVIDHPEAMSPGLAFTETMAGHISATHTAAITAPAITLSVSATTYANGAAWGRIEGSACDFHADCDHRQPPSYARGKASLRITGEVIVSALSPDPMKVREGVFRLLVADPEKAESWTMLYDMVLEGPEGPVHFHGFKTLEQRGQRGKADPWTDLTLFVTIRKGDNAQGRTDRARRAEAGHR